MKPSRLLRPILSPAPWLALALISCSKDPDPSPGERWQPVALPQANTRVLALTGVAFDGAHGVVVGYSGQVFDLAVTTRAHAWETRDGGATWELLPEPVAQNPEPAGVVLVGERILIVGDYGGTGAAERRPLILEGDRTGWQQVELPAGTGRLLKVAREFTDGARAMGLGPAGLDFVRLGNVSWQRTEIGLEPAFAAGPTVGVTDFVPCVPGPRSPICYACGFDGPAGGRDVLLGMSDTGWNRMETPWRDFDNLTAVAVTPTGALLLGGQEVDPPAQGHPAIPQALLKLQSTDGGWVDIVLPHAAQLATVNDILVTSTEETFLACGSEALHLLHVGPDAPATDEGPGTAGRVTTLAEGPGGTIWAVGEANGRALLLRRTP